MSIVRSSKFRHVFGSPYKMDICFGGLKTEGSGDTNCAVSCKFFAMVKLSKIFIVPLDKPGRQEENNMPYIDCKAKVLDVAWSPFNDCVLASGEETGDINIWVIPEDGLTDRMSTPFWELHDVHKRKVTSLAWHPSAEYVLAASGADAFVTVWDCENLRVATEIPVGEMPTNIAWNLDGSRLAITTKENRVMSLSIVDPRTGEIIHKNPECHQGTKPTKCVFMKNGDVITIGSDRQANRKIVLWSEDVQKVKFELDAGNSSSVQNPYYDMDLGILYVYGKGESNITYFEVEETEIFFLAVFHSKESQKGGNFLPKRGVNPVNCEIARFYKLQTLKCEPIGFIVPRKGDSFQSDIYPPCASDEPALTAEEWFSGKDHNPLTREFKGDLSSGHGQKKEVKKMSKPMIKKAPPPSCGSTQAASPSNGVAASSELAELLEDMKKVKATVRKLNRRVTKLEERLEQNDVVVGDAEEEEEEE